MLVTTSSGELCSQALDLGPQRHDLFLELLATGTFFANGLHSPGYVPKCAVRIEVGPIERRHACSIGDASSSSRTSPFDPRAFSRGISCSPGSLAHREEQGTFNPKVPGSRPGRPTKREESCSYLGHCCT